MAALCAAPVRRESDQTNTIDDQYRPFILWCLILERLDQKIPRIPSSGVLEAVEVSREVGYGV